jgi:predicted kinase
MKVAVLVGLPAAGKSTFSRLRFGETHVYISKDDFPSARRPARTQERRLREALEAGRDVVVDNTNASVEERAPILAVAQEFGAQAVAYVFPATVTECRERNALREGRARVPEVGMDATAKRLRFPGPEEGFAARYRVEMVEDGFEVRPWVDEGEDRPA